MNKKIEAIQIEGFRAYEQEQYFDFKHNRSRELANLIVIYAPNGYGKTSFFDAVEWAVTEKIDRITGNRAINEEAKNEKGDILKNRNSSIDHGTVKIIGEGNEIFEVKTTKRTGKMNNDYKPGKIQTITDGLKGLLDEKETFCTTNMLAHDKITTFLQTYTAEDKSKALEVFWDSKKDSKILENIIDLEKELGKRERELKSELTKNEKELKTYKFEEEKQNEVQRLIERYNLISKEDRLVIENLTNELDNSLKKGTSIIEKVQSDNMQIESLLNTVQILINEFSEFCLERKRLEEKKVEKKTNEKQIEVFNLIQIADKQKNELEKDLLSFKNILNNWETYNEIVAKIKEKIKNKNEIEKKLPALRKSSIEEKDSIRITKENIEKNNIKIKEILENKKYLERDYKIYKEKNELINRKKEREEKYSYLVQLRTKRREEFINKISSIELFLDGKSQFESIASLVEPKTLEEQKSCYNLKLKNELINKTIQELEEKYKHDVSLHNQLNQLLVKGKELISEQETCECPLCHAKYNSFSELIGRISKSNESVQQIEKLKIQIDKNKEANKETISKINVSTQRIKTTLEIILQKFRNEYDRQNLKIHKLETLLSDLNYNIQDLQKFLDEIKEKYNQQNINIQNLDAVENIKMHYQKQLSEIDKVIEDDTKKISDTGKYLEKIMRQITQIQLEIVEIDKVINVDQKNEVYIKTSNFLETHNYKVKDRSMHDIKEFMKIDIMKKNTQLQKVVQEMFEYQSKIKGSREEIDKKYNEVLIQIKELSTSYDNYIYRCQKIISTTDFKIDELEIGLSSTKKSYDEQLELQNEKINILNAIIWGINALKEQKLWRDKKIEQSLIMIKKENVSSKLVELGRSKELVQNYIIERINEYFNSEIINQIYCKIDPHPSMTHIKFQPSMTKAGQEVHIYTYDELEDDKMSPVLYLSSAQVNILSLCIFLARVLTVKDTTLNTIFMDDPIQHLDGINLLTFIDLLRTITSKMGRQIVISTHNENFYKLIRVKMDDRYYLSKFIELSSAGEIKDQK